MAKRARRTLLHLGSEAIVETAIDAESIAAFRRRKVADMCRMLGASLLQQRQTSRRQPARDMPSLSPRMQQTLQRLLVGDSEKQIARQLGVSRHTIHVYVKAIYKGFGVSSRGELLARFVDLPSFPVSRVQPKARATDPAQLRQA
jgi:DNA-binding NarL/FixJ family response regulator